MRINIIGGFLSKGLSQDSGILRGLIANQYPHAEIRKILYYLPECPEAEINIFLEVMIKLLEKIIIYMLTLMKFYLFDF